MLKVVCNRCNIDHSPVEVFGYRDNNPYANVGFGEKVYGDYRLPAGWEKILGRDFCKTCTLVIRSSMEPK